MTTDVLIQRSGALGRIRLNRPRSIHALTLPMCQAISEALLAWHDDPTVEAVLIDHAEGRGFCAGGDVVMLATSAVIAVAVYEVVGLRILRSAWVNLDRVWAGAFVAAGAFVWFA